jgi:hypothetical protein
MATGTGARRNEMDFSGAEQGGPVAPMALLPAAFAGGCFALALRFVEGRIRRRRLAGGLRGLGQLSLQGLDLLLELLDLALQLRHLALELSDLMILALEGVLNGWWGEFPLELAKGKRPQDRVGMGLRGSGHDHQGSCRCGVSSVRLIGKSSSQR